MMLTLGLILLLAWVVGVVAIKVTSAAIHLLIILAVLAFIAHFVRARARPVD
jgi:uncharacterized membrane protein (DUF485 family)